MNQDMPEPKDYVTKRKVAMMHDTRPNFIVKRRTTMKYLNLIVAVSENIMIGEYKEETMDKENNR